MPINFSGFWFENFHFLSRIGSGGYGSVWKANQTGPNREFLKVVAIKVLEGSAPQHMRQLLESFSRELRGLAALANEPIVPFHHWLHSELNINADDVPVAEPTPDTRPVQVLLLVMDLADGGSLGPQYREQMIVRATGPSYLTHLINVCVGLKAAHSRRIIHRDIKPSNLLWFRTLDEVRIADFGIADIQRDDPGASPATVAGTPEYMAPESFHPHIKDTPARDIYALGCTFYELFTGERPFLLAQDRTSEIILPPTDRIVELHKQHESAPRPEAFSKVAELLSAELSGTIRNMMDSDPHQRPSLDNVIDVLKREKHRRYPGPRTDLDHIDLDAPPRHLSAFNINPTFRIENLKESAFFIGIRLDVKTKTKYQSLFAILYEAFGTTFSIAEVYGSFTFIIRVWSTRIHVAQTCERLINGLLDDDRSSLQVMTCDGVEYLGARYESRMAHAPMATALSKLMNVQRALEEDRVPNKEELAWLRASHIYSRQLSRTIAGHVVPCICLVSEPVPISEAERDAHFDSIVGHLGRRIRDCRRLSISVYKRAYHSVDGVTLLPISSLSSDYIVTYTAPSINEVSRVLSVIVNDLAALRLRTTTMIATKRMYISSDSISDR